MEEEIESDGENEEMQVNKQPTKKKNPKQKQTLLSFRKQPETI